MSLSDDFLGGIYSYLEDRGLKVELTVFEGDSKTRLFVERGFVSVSFPEIVCRVWVDRVASNFAMVAAYLKRSDSIDVSLSPDGQIVRPSQGHRVGSLYLSRGFDLMEPDSLPWLYDFMVGVNEVSWE